MPIKWETESAKPKRRIVWDEAPAASSVPADISRIEQAFNAPEAAMPRRRPNTYDPAFGGLMAGYDDEISAAMLSPIEYARRRLKGLPRASIGESYADLQREMDADKQAYREEKPVRAFLGELGGGLATGAGMTRAGLTLAGRVGPGLLPQIGAGVTEGAAYGALVGSGEAKPGERIEGATDGAVVGGVFGGALSGVGNQIGRVMANRSVKNAPAPTIDELSAQASALYQQADQSGVMIQPNSMRRLAYGIKQAADRFNDKLRPQTLGVARDFVRMLDGNPVSLQQFDEFRRVVGNAMKGASADDVRTLTRIKHAVDNFADNIKPGDVTGDIRGFEYIKEARDLYRRKSKAETIAEMMDLAEVRTGQYTQSGAANTIRSEFYKLYKDKNRIRSFDADEKELIRKIAMSKTSSALVRWLSKFAPKGVVSASLSAGMGAMAGGPIGAAALPAVGFGAASIADRAALSAAQTVQNSAARGFLPQLPATNPLARLAPIAGLEGERLRARLGTL